MSLPPKSNESIPKGKCGLCGQEYFSSHACSTIPAEPVSDKKWAKLKIEMGPLPTDPPLTQEEEKLKHGAKLFVDQYGETMKKLAEDDAQEEKEWWRDPKYFTDHTNCCDRGKDSRLAWDIPAIIHEAEARLLEKVIGMVDEMGRHPTHFDEKNKYDKWENQQSTAGWNEFRDTFRSRLQALAEEKKV